MQPGAMPMQCPQKHLVHIRSVVGTWKFLVHFSCQQIIGQQFQLRMARFFMEAFSVRIAFSCSVCFERICWLGCRCQRSYWSFSPLSWGKRSKKRSIQTCFFWPIPFQSTANSQTSLSAFSFPFDRTLNMCVKGNLSGRSPPGLLQHLTRRLLLSWNLRNWSGCLAMRKSNNCDFSRRKVWMTHAKLKRVRGDLILKPTSAINEQIMRQVVSRLSSQFSELQYCDGGRFSFLNLLKLGEAEIWPPQMTSKVFKQLLPMW